MSEIIAGILAAAASAAADETRGKLLYRYGEGRECRQRPDGALVFSGGGLPTLVNTIEGVDLDALK